MTKNSNNKIRPSGANLAAKSLYFQKPCKNFHWTWKNLAIFTKLNLAFLLARSVSAGSKAQFRDNAQRSR